MKVTRTIKALNPDVVINAAAYRDVDSGYISRVCSEIGAILIHFSTDYVFDGTLNEYRESDISNPINVYGRSKLLGETNIAHCPERAIPGNTLHEMVYNDRIIGGLDAKSTELAKSLYLSFVKGELHLTNSTTAEMVKLMENTYRDINIALANELTQIADEYGVNVWDAIEIANKHPRVDILSPGPGVGGHCIAIDPWFLTEDTSKGMLISLSRQINDSISQYVIKLVREMVDGVENPTITIFGVAYKKDIGDTRATPAKKFIKMAEKEGYEIKIYDPYVSEFDYPVVGLEEAVEGSDCIVLLIDHSEFGDVRPGDVGGGMRSLNIVDTRNVVDCEEWREGGYEVKVIGG